MDIKNILNDADRRATAAPSSAVQPSTLSMPLATSPPNPSYTFIPQPAQQIVYTGPVYQLPPPLEVRHLGNTIHYRYTPYAYEDAQHQHQHLDYAVYQEYPEHPSQRRYQPRPPPTISSNPPDRRDDPAYRRSSRPDSHPRIVSVDGGYEYRPATSYPNSPDARLPPSSPRFSSEQRSPRRPPPHHLYSPQAQIPPPVPTPHPDMYSSSPHSRYPPPRRADPYLPYLPYPAPYPNIQQYPASEMDDYHPTPIDREHLRISDMYNPSERHRRRNSHSARPPHDDRSLERVVSSKNATRSTIEQDQIPQDDITPTFRKKTQIRKRERTRISQIPQQTPNDSVRQPLDNESISDDRPTPHYIPLQVRDTSHTPPNPPGRKTPLKRKLIESDQLLLPNKQKHPTPHMSRKQRIMEASYGAHRDVDLGARRKTKPRNSSFTKDEDILLAAHLFVDSKRTDTDTPITPSREDSVTAAVTEEEEGNVADIGETSSGNDSEVDQMKEDGSALGSEQDLPLKRPRVRAKLLRSSKSHIPIYDPKEPYPTLSSDFSTIPPEAIGDLLQMWEFVTAFAKSLRLSPFPLKHLEQAIVHQDRSPLLDACITRLVQMILSDSDLVNELGISESVIRRLSAKNTKNQVLAILDELPRILSFESDEVDDHFLHSTVRKLAKSSNKWAFYKEIDAAAKLRILRELIDYATMSDILRECISDSMDHAEEEKKKAREENSANRKRLELQLRELRTELLDFRTKNGLLEPVAESEGEKGGATSGGKEKSSSADHTEDSVEKEEVLSRQEKLLAAQKERKQNEKRRVNEREAEAMTGKIDKVRANLKTLKNIRLRNRTGNYARESDIAASSMPPSQMPLQQRHEDPVRTYPIGIDRENRCYWFFQGCGRIWVEDTEKSMWGALCNKEDIELLLKWLSPSRREEQELKKNVERRLDNIVAEMAAEAKMIEAAELEDQETQDSGPENGGRTTRAGKRKANNEALKMKAAKSKKSKLTRSFMEYRNVEK